MAERKRVTEKIHGKNTFIKKRYKCQQIDVPKEVCYIRFKKDVRIYGSLDYENKFMTARGEDMVFDVDKEGKIVGIELLGNKEARKPCQEG